MARKKNDIDSGIKKWCSEQKIPEEQVKTIQQCAHYFADFQRRALMDAGIDLIVRSSLDAHGVDYGIPEIRLGGLFLESLGIHPRDRVKVILMKYPFEKEL